MKVVTDFVQTLRFCEKHNLYLGRGNPDADILIIGKEPAIGADDPYTLDDLFEKREWALVANNLKMWGNYQGKKYHYAYNPNQIQHNYQTLVDVILKRPNEKKAMDFEKYCFTSVMSQIPLLDENELPPRREALRTASILKRLLLFKMPFFQTFPMVVLAIGDTDTVDSHTIFEIFGTDSGSCGYGDYDDDDDEFIKEMAIADGFYKYAYYRRPWRNDTLLLRTPCLNGKVDKGLLLRIGDTFGKRPV